MSTRITTGMVQRSVLADLNNVSERLTKTQTKVASGREINRPSDDPFNASRALALREDLGATRQLQRNAEDAVGWQEATEVAMAQITDTIHKAKELLIQGGSDGVPQVARDNIAEEIEQIIDGVKQYANATYSGRYLFSGTATTTPPYRVGATAPDAYGGDADPIARQIGPGVALTINTLGSDVLGGGQVANDGKLLHVLRDIADHLRAGDGAALRGSDVARLESNLDGVLELRALNGARSNRIESAISRLGEVEVATLEQLSQTEDADIARTLIDLNSQQAAYQAALRAGASIVQSSLMDFLR